MKIDVKSKKPYCISSFEMMGWADLVFPKEKEADKKEIADPKPTKKRSVSQAHKAEKVNTLETEISERSHESGDKGISK